MSTHAERVAVRRAYVDLDYGQMHVRMAGKDESAQGGARPLVCFHMSPQSGRVYERFLAPMGQDRLVIAPDTPGFGASDGLPEIPEIADYARAMIAMLDALGIAGPVDLTGYHTGAMIAMELARLAPARVGRLILISACVLTDEEREQFRALYAHRVPTMDGSHLSHYWQEMVYWYAFGGSTLEEVERHYGDAVLGGEAGALGHRAAFNYYPEQVFKDLPHPLLLLNPRDDLRELTRRAEPLLRRGAILEIPGWGHGFFDRHPVGARDLYRSFCDADADSLFESVTLPRGSGAYWYDPAVSIEE